MPTYEYLCNKCEHKGSGFYKTDSRSSPVTKSEKPADKTESKPEKKVEKKVVPKAEN